MGRMLSDKFEFERISGSVVLPVRIPEKIDQAR